MRVQQPVGFRAIWLAKALMVDIGNRAVFLGAMGIMRCVNVAYRLCPLCPCLLRMCHRLTATPDAASRTGHYFNEISLALSRLNLFYQFFCLCQAIRNRHADFATRCWQGKLTTVFATADFFYYRIIVAQVPGHKADDCLGYPAGIGKDDPRAGLYAEWLINPIHRQFVELDSAFKNHAGQFLRG